MTITDTSTSSTKRTRKMAREPQVETLEASTAPWVPAKRESKINLVLQMLRRAQGASIEQISQATRWLPHTTRAALTGLKKKGHAVTSVKLDDGSRIYRVGEA